jgi:hypothetical protein
MSWFTTDWFFVTSAGTEITAGEIVNIGAGGGSFYVKKWGTDSVLELKYGVLGLGAGVGLPVNIDTSTVNMPSRGMGQIMGNNRHSLRPSDFDGWCSMAGIQVAPGLGGGSVLSVYFNIPLVGSWTDARAWGRIGGTTVGLQFGAGAMFYGGRISRGTEQALSRVLAGQPPPVHRVRNARWD